MGNRLIAQIDTVTRFVGAVVDMAEPIAEPPAGKEFVEVQDYSCAGKYHVDGKFQDDKP